MLLFVIAYLGGVLTIISPCILPVVPFVFARADRSFLKNGLPIRQMRGVTPFNRPPTLSPLKHVPARFKRGACGDMFLRGADMLAAHQIPA